MSRGMQWKERQEDRSQINQWNVTGGGGNTVHASSVCWLFPAVRLGVMIRTRPSDTPGSVDPDERCMQLSVNPVHGSSQNSFNHGPFLLTGQEKEMEGLHDACYSEVRRNCLCQSASAPTC